MWLIVLASFLHCASAYDVDLKKLDGLAKARVEVQYSKAFMIVRLKHGSKRKYIFQDSISAFSESDLGKGA